MIRIDNLQKSNVSELDEFKWNGFYRALVLDAHDERQLGRVKVRIPDLMPEDGAEDCGPWSDNGLWAHPANNCMGGRNLQDTMGIRANFEDAWYQGSCLIPPKGSWVWIFFECGDPNHPYYFGAGDFGQRKVLPENQNGAEWEKKWTLYKSRQGRCIIISDDPDDCRVEITGKKRMISNPPDGDGASVFDIDGNQTVILLDEREGKENLLIKDYRGNFIRMHINDNGIKDQLHVFFQDDIHIETLKNLYVKVGDDMHVKVGKDYRRTVGRMTNTFSIGPHFETALTFNRLAMLGDTTTAGLHITEISGAWNSTLTVAMVTENSIGINQRNCCGEIDDTGLVKIALESASIHETSPLINLGTGVINLCAEVNVLVLNEGSAAPPLPPIFPIPLAMLPLPALLAKKAAPEGDRHQELSPQKVPEPVLATGMYKPSPTYVTTPPIGDSYMKTFEDIPPTPPESNHPLSKIPQSKIPQSEIPLNPIIITPVDESVPPVVTKGVCGLGHIYLLQLKDMYRDKVIPLIEASCGKYVSFSVFKDPISSNTEMEYNCDTDYMDPEVVPVYSQYRAGDSEYNWDIDDTTKWWQNLDEVCRQAASYSMTVVPTLFDFYDSPYCPFVTQIDESPSYNTVWNPVIYGPFLRTIIHHIQSSGAKYILNIGYRSYTQSTNISKIYPSSDFLKKLISYLIDECSVSANEISLTSNQQSNLFGKCPVARYKSYYGYINPGSDQLNIEEYVDSNWGGTGRVSVYNDKEELIDGYTYFLNHSQDGIPILSHWKMKKFEESIPAGCPLENIMNYIFAPRQREAMRIVYGDDDITGFVDFT